MPAQDFLTFVQMDANRKKPYPLLHKETEWSVVTDHNDKAGILHEHFDSLLGKKERFGQALNWDYLNIHAAN